MQADRPIRLARIASEGAVIVVSILLALAADAWFEQRQEVRLETAELEGLRAQLGETRQLLLSSIAADEAGLSATTRLLQSIGDAEGTVPVLDSLLARQGYTTMFVAPLSRFEAIAASGRLVLIRDDDLRAAISGWPMRANNATALATRRRDFWEEDFMPGLWADQDVDHWFYTATPSGAMISITVDNALKNMLRQRQFLDRVVITRGRIVMDQLDELLQMVEGALGAT